MKASVVATFLAVAALVAPSAAAGAPTQDSVTGTAAVGAGRDFTRYTFDVHSGPAGENPTGTVTLDTFFGVIGPLDVTCLSTRGNRATMFAEAPPNTSGVVGLVLSVEDDGPGLDKIDRQLATTRPADCPVPSDVLQPTLSGDVAVIDAQTPSTYAQCRQAGWSRTATPATGSASMPCTSSRDGSASSSESPSGSRRSGRSTGWARATITPCGAAFGALPASRPST